MEQREQSDVTPEALSEAKSKIRRATTSRRIIADDPLSDMVLEDLQEDLNDDARLGGKPKPYKFTSTKPPPRYTYDANPDVIEADVDEDEDVFTRQLYTPAEILTQGPEAYQIYIQAVAEGKKAIHRTRLMLVGQERVGKTSLIKTLTSQKYDAKEASTDGIDVSRVCSIDIVHAESWDVRRETLSTGMFVGAVGAQLAKTFENNFDQKHQDHPSVTMITKQDQQRNTTKNSKSSEIRMELGDKEGVKESLADSRHNVIPPEIISAMDDTLQRDTEALTFSIWDFAGQDLYYTTHQVFLSRRCVYIVVFDLTQELILPKPVVEQSQLAKGASWLFEGYLDLEIRQDAVQQIGQSHMDVVDFWLRSIYTFVTAHGNPQDVEGPRSPPIFIVGTHRGSKRNTKRVEKIIREFVRGKCYEANVIPRYYAVENSLKDNMDDEVVTLRQDIEEVARKQPYMGEEIPIKWLQFEKIISDQVLQGNTVLSFDEVKRLPGVEIISSNEEFHVMLQFYHDLGNIVYFADIGTDSNNLVVLNPHWLIDVFRRIITWKDMDLSKQVAKSATSLELKMTQLQTSGILDDELAAFLWRDLIGRTRSKQAEKQYLIRVMDKFDLLCERLPSKQMKNRTPIRKSYYVPARLDPSSKPRSLTKIVGPSTVFFVDFSGFLPEGFFHRLLTRCARWSQEQGGLEPKLHYRHAICYADDCNEFELGMLSAKEAAVKITVYPCLDIAGVRRSHLDVKYLLTTATNKVKVFLENTLSDLKNTWVKGIVYRFTVACPCATERHFLDLDDCLQYQSVVCNLSRKRVDTSKIKSKFTESTDAGLSHQFEQLNLQSYNDPTSTCSITSNGGELRIRETAIHLMVPEGAIPTGETINITLTLPLDREPPPLDDDHLMISPIVKCEPDGYRFLKPVELTLPSYAGKVDPRDVTVWTKSKSIGDCKWVRILKVQNSSMPSRQLISIGNDTIKLALWHFSDDGISAPSAISIDILVFQNPRSLSESDQAFITVYAIPEDMTQTLEDRLKATSLKVAFRQTMQFEPDSEKNLKVQVSEVLPAGWNPVSNEGEIYYKDIQSRKTHPCKQFRFIKTKKGDVSSISGAYIFEQHTLEETKSEYYFASNFFEGATPNMGRKQESSGRKRSFSEYSGMDTKRSKTGDQEVDVRKASSKDFMDVIRILTRDDLRMLYYQLDIDNIDIDNAERAADSNNVIIRAMEVFNWWKKTHPSKATRRTLLKALGECELTDPKQRLEDKWSEVS